LVVRVLIQGDKGMRASGKRRAGRGILAIGLLASLLAVAPSTPAGVGEPIEVVAAAMGIAEDVPELKAGRAAAHQLETTNDSELCAAGSIVIEAPLAALANSFRDLSLLERGGLVTASGRIPAQPSESNFAALPLPESDLLALRTAKPGNSDIKLAADEIEAIRKSTSDGVLPAFRRALLDRVVAWRGTGLAGLRTYDDKKSTIDQASVTRALLESLSRTNTRKGFEQIETFEYWSVERFGSLKPFVALTSMTVREQPGAVRIDTIQIYASHYCEGLVASIDLQALPDENGPRTLVRLTFRTQVDGLGGLLGAVKRKVGRSRMVAQLVEGLEQLRDQAPRVTQLTELR
jgi:hypothetical protein